MSVFIDLPADPIEYNILEIRMSGILTYEDSIAHTLFNVFHYHKASGTGAVDLQAFVNWFQTTVATPVVARLNVRVTDVNSEIRPLDDPLVPLVQQTAGLLAGSITGDPLSASLAAVVQLTTGVRGRSFKGSKHFGGLSEDDSDGGDELNATTIAAWSTAVNELRSQGNDGGSYLYNPCVLSPTLSDILGTPPSFTGADITGSALNKIIGTMRKRKERISS